MAIPARGAVSPKGIAKAFLLTIAMIPATTQYALHTRANKRAKLTIWAIRILPVCKAATLFVAILDS
jgi:hypothetical protein